MRRSHLAGHWRFPSSVLSQPGLNQPAPHARPIEPRLSDAIRRTMPHSTEPSPPSESKPNPRSIQSGLTNVRASAIAQLTPNTTSLKNLSLRRFVISNDWPEVAIAISFQFQSIGSPTPAGYAGVVVSTDRLDAPLVNSDLRAPWVRTTYKYRDGCNVELMCWFFRYYKETDPVSRTQLRIKILKLIYNFSCRTLVVVSRALQISLRATRDANS